MLLRHLAYGVKMKNRPSPASFLAIICVLFAFVIGCYIAAWWLTPTFRQLQKDPLPPQQVQTPITIPVQATPSIKTTRVLQRRDLPRWIANATPVKKPKTPYIAIVLDDMGVHEPHSANAINKLPKEVTFSFLPYGKATLKQAFKARILGHEIMIHLPMEPQSHAEEPTADPGPAALYLKDDLTLIRDKTKLNLELLSAMAVGVNNHMGSRFTEWPEGMRTVLEVLQSEKLFYLDSLTTANSAVPTAATGLDIPIIKRQIFLDHYQTAEKINSALKKLVLTAKRNGKAIAIGHPHPETVQALITWLPTLKEQGLTLVPISLFIE